MTVGPDHERWEDTAGAYVLGALPDDERAAYEAHLAACSACRAEAEELRMAAQALPVSSPPMLPPPALKARIMAEVEREAALLASAGEPREESPRRRLWRRGPAEAGRRRGVEAERRAGRFWGLPMPAVALACAALLAGVVIGAFAFGGGGGGGRSIDFASTLPRASAELEVTEGSATLVAHGLPAPPAGKVYMVWIQRPGRAPEPTSALFTPRRDGSATASVTGDLDGVETVLVNTEPLGGSTTPTSAPVLTASLS